MHSRPGPSGGGKYFTKFSELGSAHDNRLYPIRSSFVKMRDKKDLRSMKKGVNWIKHQGENLYKMLKNS